MASGTPSAQVRIPVGDLIYPPHFCSHYTTLGKNYPAAEETSVGVKINRRRHTYPGRPQVGKKFKKFSSKISHTAENCRTVPKIPYLNTLREPFLIHYTILTHCRPILIH